MRRWRDTDGQATGEYVSLILLVAVTLVLAAGLTSGGIGARVLAGVQRGLCAVVGHACAPPTSRRADLAPCPVARMRRDERLGGVLDVVRLGTSATLSAVRRSDGRVTVMLADGVDGGGELGVGLRLAAGERTAGGVVRASLAQSWRSGRSWTLPSAAAAHAFIARFGDKATVGGRLVDELRSRCSLLCDALGWHPHAQLPPPDEAFTESGTIAQLAASLGPAAVSASSGAMLGVRHGRDGSSTWYLRIDRAAASGLQLPAGGLGTGARGPATVAYALDPHGQPQSLAIQLAGRLGADASLTAARDGVRVSGSAARGVAVELDARLDLHTPANRKAAMALVLALLGSHQLPLLPRALAAVGARIAREGELDRRLYSLESSATEFGAQAALGVELGGDFERTTEGLRLLSAETRLPGLPFLPRDDCRGA